MDKFFNFKFEIQLYGKIQNQKDQSPINFYWSYVASGSNPLK